MIQKENIRKADQSLIEKMALQRLQRWGERSEEVLRLTHELKEQRNARFGCMQ